MLRATVCFRQYMYGSDYLAFPASGNRTNGSGGFNNVSVSGFSWSSSSTGTGSVNGTNLGFNATVVNTLNNNNRSHAFPLRCVQEFAMQTGLSITMIKTLKTGIEQKPHEPGVPADLIKTVCGRVVCKFSNPLAIGSMMLCGYVVVSFYRMTVGAFTVAFLFPLVHLFQ